MYVRGVDKNRHLGHRICPNLALQRVFNDPPATKVPQDDLSAWQALAGPTTGGQGRSRDAMAPNTPALTGWRRSGLLAPKRHGSLCLAR
jgi:hypothetical protein